MNLLERSRSAAAAMMDGTVPASRPVIDETPRDGATGQRPRDET
jgi:hypothetical protein